MVTLVMIWIVQKFSLGGENYLRFNSYFIFMHNAFQEILTDIHRGREMSTMPLISAYLVPTFDVTVLPRLLGHDLVSDTRLFGVLKNRLERDL